MPGIARIFISGFGTVGREFARTLTSYSHELERLGLRAMVIGVADSKGAYLAPSGLDNRDLDKLLSTPRGGVSSLPGGEPGMSVPEAIEKLEPDILVEVTPSNYSDGEPGITHIRAALRLGIDVVTANKAPLALAFDEVSRLAEESNVYLGIRATVMAGTPLIDFLNGFKGRRIETVRGVLNATTAYILGLVEEGLSFEEALERARREGYAEPDPSLDLDGWDPAAKLSIISGIMGRWIPLKYIERIPLRPENIPMNRGVKVRYVAELGEEARVEPRVVEGFLASLKPPANGVEVTVDGYTYTVSGTGGGPRPTALALLSDVVEAGLRRRWRDQ